MDSGPSGDQKRMDPHRTAIGRLYRADEAATVSALLDRADLPAERWAKLEADARRLVESTSRARRAGASCTERCRRDHGNQVAA